MNYAPVSRGETEKVCKPGDFVFSVIGMDHGHIYGMCNGLIEAGATLSKAYDRDPVKLAGFLKTFPQAAAASSAEEILADADCRLVASAIQPDERAALGLRVLAAGKDYFADKPGMLKPKEIDAVEAACKSTGRKYLIYFSERIHVEGAVLAEQLIQNGAIGRVIHATILAPHRLDKHKRPAYFFDPDLNGGIITDIGSHQIEQFLAYSGADTAKVTHSTLSNYANRDKSLFYDYGDGNLVADNGATCYFRVDWFTPDGLGSWGDGRVFIIGTEGTIEIRKYIDVANSPEGDLVFLVDRQGEHKIQAGGTTGFPFFGALILDCLHRTENAISQHRCLEAMRITIQAQSCAEIIAEIV